MLLFGAEVWSLTKMLYVLIKCDRWMLKYIPGCVVLQKFIDKFAKVTLHNGVDTVKISYYQSFSLGKGYPKF